MSEHHEIERTFIPDPEIDLRDLFGEMIAELEMLGSLRGPRVTHLEATYFAPRTYD